MWLALENVAVRLGANVVVSGLTATAAEAELVAVIGPNGAGKSTLLRAIAGLIPASGSIRTFGQDPQSAARKSLARDVAYLPQQYDLAFPFVVEEVVLLGRYSYQRGLGLASNDDRAAAREAMAACDVEHLAARRFDELSGGETRRVILAQALCQGARALLLDEPTAGLDPQHARRVFAILRERKTTAIVVTHDLDLALRFATTIWLLSGGVLAAKGNPGELLISDETKRAFGLSIHVGELPSGERFAVPA